MANDDAPADVPWSMTRAPSSRSTTTIGSGATNGAGIVWLTTNVCTVPWRARGTASSLAPPHDVHVGWTEGGTLIVPQSTHRAPRRPRISAFPRTKAALPGG